MLGEVAPERHRRSLVEQYSHEGAVLAKARNSWSSTASTFHRSTPWNHSRNSSIEAPAFKFSNRAETGTRVP